MLDHLFMDFGRRQGRRSLIVCTSDEMAVFVARRRAILAEWFVLPEVARSFQRNWLISTASRRYADATAYPIPPSIQIDTMTQLDAVLDEIELPVIVKSIELRGHVQSVENSTMVRTREGNCANWPVGGSSRSRYCRRNICPMSIAKIGSPTAADADSQGGRLHRPEGPHLAPPTAVPPPPYTPDPSWWPWRETLLRPGGMPRHLRHRLAAGPSHRHLLPTSNPRWERSSGCSKTRRVDVVQGHAPGPFWPPDPSRLPDKPERFIVEPWDLVVSFPRRPTPRAGWVYRPPQSGVASPPTTQPSRPGRGNGQCARFSRGPGATLVPRR